MSGRGRGRGRGRAQAAREPTEEERAATVIAEWMGRDHRNPMWVDPVFLDESGLRNEVTAMFRRSGWSGAVTLISDADKNDTSEFIASLEYHGPQDHEGFTYRHRGVSYRCTMQRLRDVFGWRQPVENVALGRYYPAERDWLPAWRALSRVPFSAGNNTAASLTEPIMFYIHHLLCKTIFAKKHADKIGQDELGVLTLLRAGTVVNWGHYFIKHVANLQTRSPIMVGGMVTHLLRTLHPDFPVPERHTILRPFYMDRIWFQNGSNIQVTHDGGVQWCYFRDPALRPPPVPRRPRGRPPAPEQALVIQDPDQQGRPRHSFERGESSSQQQHYQPESSGGFQEQLYRAQTDAFFNATRASLMPGVEIAYVPAPPGWRAGDPIPHEFMTPFPPAGGY